MKTYVAIKHSVIFGRLFYPGDEVDAEECPSQFFKPKIAEVPQVVDLSDEESNADEIIGADAKGVIDEVLGEQQPSETSSAEEMLKMTVDQLKELAAAKGIELPSKANKGIIVGMLMQQ